MKPSYRKSKLNKSKKSTGQKSSWGGWRPGAGRKKKVPEVYMESMYEIVAPDTEIELVDDGKPEAEKIKHPRNELDRLFNKGIDGDVRALKKYLNLALGRVRY